MTLRKSATLALAFAAIAFAQQQNAKPHRSFENLKEIKGVKYDPSISTVIMKKLKDLDSDYNKTFPDYKDYKDPDDCSGDEVLILKTKISSGVNKHYYVVSSSQCASDDGLLIYEEGNKDYIKYFDRVSLVISGGGSVYTEGGYSRKFDFTGGKFVEVKQPFYYIGLKTRTLKTVILYQDKSFKKAIATLPANYEIEVLLREPKGDYLARTSFGLVGWVKLASELCSNEYYCSTDVENLMILAE
jgi:hypothetical protein